MRGRVEEVRRQPDDGFELVVLDQALADLPSRAASEQHAVRHDDADPARLRLHRGDHVLDPGEVAVPGRRHAAEGAAPGVGRPACRRPSS